jgi:hypothetical protein
MDDLNVQNSELKFGQFQNVNTIDRYMFCEVHHHKKAFLCILRVSEAGLSRLKENWMPILCSLRSGLPFHWAAAFAVHTQHKNS